VALSKPDIPTNRLTDENRTTQARKREHLSDLLAHGQPLAVSARILRFAPGLSWNRAKFATG